MGLHCCGCCWRVWLPAHGLAAGQVKADLGFTAPAAGRWASPRHPVYGAGMGPLHEVSVRLCPYRSTSWRVRAIITFCVHSC